MAFLKEDSSFSWRNSLIRQFAFNLSLTLCRPVPCITEIRVDLYLLGVKPLRAIWMS
jgi:hypothetical protein